MCNPVNVKDVQGPQLVTGAWAGAPYKGCRTMMAAIFLFRTTIKCNVSQLNPLLIIGNHPSTSFRAILLKCIKKFKVMFLLLKRPQVD